MNPIKNKLVISLTIAFLLGGFVGFVFGVGYTIDKGLDVMERLNVTLDIDSEAVKSAIFQYKNLIGGCGNALVYNNTGN